QALANVDGAGADADAAVATDADVGALERSGSSDLGVHGEANAGQAPGQSSLRVGLPQPRVLQHAHRGVQGKHEIAAVEADGSVNRTEASIKWECLGGQQIAAA